MLPPNSYAVARLSETGLSSIACYFGKTLLEHILYSVSSTNLRISNSANHKCCFHYYGENQIYFSRAESELFRDLNPREEKEIRKLVVNWLQNARDLFDPTELSLDFYVTDETVGVRYVKH